MGRHAVRGFTGARLTAARAAYRDGRGISQSDLARISGVSVTSINKWENGHSIPQPDLLRRVGEALELPFPMEALIDVPRNDRYLSDWRALFGLLQGELAEMTGVDNAVISAIERGTRPPTEVQRERFAEVYGITPDEVQACNTRAQMRPL